MSRQQFIDSGDPKAKSKYTVEVPIGRYQGYKLVIKGTTDTGQTLAPEDIGRLRMERNGQQKMSETFEFFHDYSDIKGGYPTATLPTAGASRIVAYIPASYVSPNSMDVLASDELKFFLEFNNTTLSTRFGANEASWEFVGLEAEEVPEAYELNLFEHDVQASGATRKVFTIDHSNIACLFVKDPDDVLESILVRIDKKTATNNIDFENLLDDTAIENNIEASGLDLVELKYIANSIEEAVNGSTEVEIEFTGAGTVEITGLKVEYLSSDRLASNVNRVRNIKQQKRANVSNKNKPQALPEGAVRFNR